MKDFAGTTAVVTGAASGIGLALAERFAAARMRVVLADIEEDALSRAVEQLEARQAEVIGVPVNTMVRESVFELAERAIDAFGKVHVLCNNAGVVSTSSANAGIWELPESEWDWVLGVNLHGVLYGLQAFVPHMLEHGESGHIVNTASLAALMPATGSYGVSKHGVLVLTENLYNDLKARDAAIGASVLCPGLVNTQIYDAERNRPSELRSDASDAPSEAIAVGRALLEQGKAPAAIAEAVAQSIEEDRLYILPHPPWDDFVRSRIEHVLARSGPAAVDLGAIAAGLARGEQF